MLVQHKCIGNGDIQQKVKYILVELSTFRPAAIIPSELVASIHPSHELEMMASGHGTEIWDPSFCLRRTVPVAVGSPVLPGRSCHTSLLDCEWISPIAC